jgi:hypothetical protein
MVTRALWSTKPLARCMALAAQVGNRDNTVLQDSMAHSKEQGHDPSAASLLETTVACQSV